MTDTATKATLSPSEAVYGFAAWLTSRDDGIVVGALYDAAIVADLVDEFCKRNGLPEPRDHWSKNLKYPSKPEEK